MRTTFGGCQIASSVLSLHSLGIHLNDKYDHQVQVAFSSVLNVAFVCEDNKIILGMQLIYSRILISPL